MIAKIWVSKPDVNDGYFVELVEPLSKRDTSLISIDQQWFAEIMQCEAWAISKGAAKIDYV